MIGSFWAVPLLMLGLALADFLCWVAAGMKPGDVESLVCLAYLKEQAFLPEAALSPIVAHMFIGTLVSMLGLFFLQPLGWLTTTLSLLRSEPWWPLLIGIVVGEAWSFLLWFLYQWAFAVEFYLVHVPFFFVFAIPCLVVGVNTATGALQWQQRMQDKSTIVVPEARAFTEL